MISRIESHFYLISILILVCVSLSGCDKPNPEQIRQLQHLPNPNFKADANKGEVLFNGHCAHCHGKDAQGSNQGPPLIHKVYRPGHHADLTFHWAINDGVKQHHWQFGDMPPQPQVTPEMAGHIIAYIRTEQRKHGIE